MHLFHTCCRRAFAYHTPGPTGIDHGPGPMAAHSRVSSYFRHVCMYSFICLCEVERKKEERELDLLPIGLIPQQPKLAQAKDNNPNALQVSHSGGRCPGTWAILCYLSRHVIRTPAVLETAATAQASTLLSSPAHCAAIPPSPLNPQVVSSVTLFELFSLLHYMLSEGQKFIHDEKLHVKFIPCQSSNAPHEAQS